MNPRTELPHDEPPWDAIMDCVTEGLCTVDTTARLTGCNAAARAILGRHGGNFEGVGQLIWDAVPGLKESAGGRALLQTLRERVPTQTECYVGTWGRWLGLRHVPFPQSGAVAICFQDITPRKRAERFQEAQRAVLETVATGAPMEDCFEAVTEALGALITGARAAVAMANTDRSAIGGCYGGVFAQQLRAFILRAPIGADAMGPCGQAIFRGDAVRCDDVDGAAIPERWRELCSILKIRASQSLPVRGPGGDAVASLFLAFDAPRALDAWEKDVGEVGGRWIALVLERERARETLRTSEERLRLAQIGGGVGLWDWSAATNETDWSATMWRLYGRAEEFGPGRTHEIWVESLHPEDRPRMKARVGTLFTSDDLEFRDEFRIVRPDGALRWIEVTARVERDAAGQVLRMYGTNVDITQRIGAEHQLRASEAQFRTLAEAMPALVSLADADGRLLYISPHWTEFSGLSQDAFLSGQWHEAIHPDDRERIVEAWREAVTTGQPYHYEFRARAAGGVFRWMLARGQPVREAHGMVVQWVNCAVDIEERKRDEAALKRAAEELARERERLDVALRAGQLGVFEWHLRDDTIWWSPEMYPVYGVEPDAFCPSVERIVALLHPDDRAAISEHVRRSVATRSMFVHEHRIVRPDGAVRWILTRSHVGLGADGIPDRVTGVAADITETRLREEALRQSESRFRSLTALIMDLPWTTDAHGAFIEPQPAWESYTGQTWDDYRGYGWAMALHPDDRDRLKEAWLGAVQNRRSFESSGRIWHAERNEYRHFTVRAMASLAPDGSVKEWIGACTDVHEREMAAHRLEQLVAQRTAALEEKVGELEAFSYSVSHDMRGPLRSMQGFARALLEEHSSQLDPTAQDYLQRIVRGSERLDLLVRDVLAYTRLAKGEFSLQRVRLEGLIHDVIAAFEFDPQRIQIEAPLPPVIGHAALLTQIFSNLLGNALKFVRPGVPVQVRIWSERRANRVRVWVEDNGLGIAPEHFERIFEIFGRVHADWKYEGTGIGLAIVRKAVERLGGAVGVESALGQGSRFWVELNAAA